MASDVTEMNNLNQSSTHSSLHQPDILQGLNIIEPSAPPAEQVLCDDEKPTNCDVTYHHFQQPQQRFPSYDIKAPGKLVEIPDIKAKERRRRRVRQVKKSVGVIGWVLCAPLMLLGLCIRDQPDVNDDDEWRDDPCLPCYYDVNFRYPGER